MNAHAAGELRRVDPWGPSFERECDRIYSRFLKYTTRLPAPLASRALDQRSYLGDQRSRRLDRIPDIIRVITILPYLLVEVFPVERSKVSKLAYALTVGGLYAMAEDKLIDSQAELTRSHALLVPSLYGEFVRALFNIFPQSSDFWSYHDRFFREYQMAEVKDSEGTDRGAGAHRYNIAKAKSAPMKLALRGMAILSGRSDQVSRLSRSFDCWIIGYQLYDDVIDWREDYSARRNSLTMSSIRQLVKSVGPSQNTSRLSHIEKIVHSSDVIESMLAQSGDWFERAAHSVDGIPCDNWIRFLRNFNHIATNTIKGLVSLKMKLLFSE